LLLIQALHTAPALQLDGDRTALTLVNRDGHDPVAREAEVVEKREGPSAAGRSADEGGSPASAAAVDAPTDTDVGLVLVLTEVELSGVRAHALDRDGVVTGAPVRSDVRTTLLGTRNSTTAPDHEVQVGDVGGDVGEDVVVVRRDHE